MPDLLLEQADEPHVGSIDVDLALDAKKLADGRYADLLKLLLDTGRYKLGAKPFQLVVEVDLKDGLKADTGSILGHLLEALGQRAQRSDPMGTAGWHLNFHPGQIERLKGVRSERVIAEGVEVEIHTQADDQQQIILILIAGKKS